MNLRIKEIREQYHYSQAQVAEILHCTPQKYAEYETGKIAIDTDKIVLLADFYHTSVDYLLGLTEQIEPHKNKKAGN